MSITNMPSFEVKDEFDFGAAGKAKDTCVRFDTCNLDFLSGRVVARVSIFKNKSLMEELNKQDDKPIRGVGRATAGRRNPSGSNFTKSFIYELTPAELKSKDLLTQIRNKIKKEFGTTKDYAS